MSEHTEPVWRGNWDVDPGDLSHATTNVVLNTPFVHAIGREKAEQMIAVINDIGSRLKHHSRPEITEALRRGFHEIEVNVPQIEMGRFADEIARFNKTEAHLGPEGEY